METDEGFNKGIIMCGICGSISNQNIDPDIVRKMNQVLIHRGPDGEGEFFDGGIGLAMRRLSIIDLKRGWQPLSNEENSLILVINGEIYNYIELRRNLLLKGHIFKTQSDGETILHLYEDHGVNCLAYLRGMFAFALWDKKKKQLFIARDRMGEKPLYFSQGDNQILFSSELKSLLASRQIILELDPFSIDLYFHFHYIPEPYTPIKRIRKLQAGHYLLINNYSEVKEYCYWKIEDAPKLNGDRTKEIHNILEEVGKLIIRSDVPVGIALSGGIDSSLVAALASKNYCNNMHAFTVGYSGKPEVDERSNARKIADFLGLEFHEIELSTFSFVDSFPRICSLTDDPIADISAFGYYSISKAAKEAGIPVLLQGQGGDELAWGYENIRNNYFQALLKQKALKYGLISFPYYYNYAHKLIYKRKTIRKFLKASILGVKEALLIYRKHVTENPEIFPFYDNITSFNTDFSPFYGDLMLGNITEFSPNIFNSFPHPWKDVEIMLTQLIASTYLIENGIAQGDRLSMANSVELRLPLIDHKLIETIIGFRKGRNDIYESPKKVFTEVAKEVLPSWIFEIPKKGFTPPVEEWCDTLIKQYGEKLLTGKLINRGIINSNFAGSLYNGRIKSTKSFPIFFNMLVLEFWLDNI